MQRAMARQAEAEREKRAKIIHAAGELEASSKLSQAAGVIATEPIAITLRYLQTLTEIAAEKNSTIIFPLPIEMLHLLQAATAKNVAARVRPLPATTTTSAEEAAVLVLELPGSRQASESVNDSGGRMSTFDRILPRESSFFPWH